MMKKLPHSPLERW